MRWSHPTDHSQADPLFSPTWEGIGPAPAGYLETGTIVPSHLGQSTTDTQIAPFDCRVGISFWLQAASSGFARPARRRRPVTERYFAADESPKSAGQGRAVRRVGTRTRRRQPTTQTAFWRATKPA
jgi:hypothetical protein